MQHWMKVNWQLHPQFNNDSSYQNLLKIEETIFQASIKQGALVSKGSWFRAESGTGSEMYFRATFAAAPANKVAEAISRFGQALKAEFEIGTKENLEGHRASNGTKGF